VEGAHFNGNVVMDVTKRAATSSQPSQTAAPTPVARAPRAEAAAK
jgi:hypothetical protein